MRTDMHNLKLSEEIKRAINELGYTEATPVQKAVIPVALTGKISLLNHKLVVGKQQHSLFLLLNKWNGKKINRKH